MWSTFLFEEPSPKSELKVEKTKLFVRATMVEMAFGWRLKMKFLGERRECLMMKSEVRVVMRSLLQRVDPLKTEEIISEHLVHAQHVDSTV